VQPSTRIFLRSGNEIYLPGSISGEGGRLHVGFRRLKARYFTVEVERVEAEGGSVGEESAEVQEWDAFAAASHKVESPPIEPLTVYFSEWPIRAVLEASASEGCVLTFSTEDSSTAEIKLRYRVGTAAGPIVWEQTKAAMWQSRHPLQLRLRRENFDRLALQLTIQADRLPFPSAALELPDRFPRSTNRPPASNQRIAMSFTALQERWEELGRPQNAAAMDRDTEYRLRSPSERGLLTACVMWLRDPRSRAPLPDSNLMRAWFPDPAVRAAAECHLDILRMLGPEGSGALDKAQNLRAGLKQITDQRNLPLGQVEELYHEISALQSGTRHTEVDGRLSCGPMRMAEVGATAPLILVSSNNGIPATLTVEAIDGGNGDIWAVPALMLVDMDKDWRGTPEMVRDFFAGRGVSLAQYHFRYRITFQGDVRWPLALQGASWCGQLQMVMLCVLHQLQPASICSKFHLPRLMTSLLLPCEVTSAGLLGRIIRHFPRLVKRRAVITAAVMRSTDPGALTWVKVRDVMPKLVTAVKQTVPRIRIVVVANGQEFDSLAYRRLNPKRAIWSDPEGEFKLIMAKTFDEALTLWQHSQRWKRRLMFLAATAIPLVAMLVAFLPRQPLPVDELVTAIQTEEFRQSGTNSVLAGFDRWRTHHGFSRKRGLAHLRAYCEERSVGLSRDPRAIFLWDKLGPVAGWPKRDSNEWVINVNGLRLQRVHAGSFWMGTSEDDEQGKADETPQKRVTINQPFWIGKYEVTQEEFEIVQGYNPSFYNGSRKSNTSGDEIDHGRRPGRPVEALLWQEAVAFCEELTRLERKKINSVVGTNYVFRLPTEAEWEYACRAGATNRYGFGQTAELLDDYAWYQLRNTRNVGLKLPNPWGLYDLQGNVNELCLDGYKENGFLTNAVNPVYSTSNHMKVARGGAFLDQDPRRFRCADRHGWGESKKGNTYGFRVVLAQKVELLETRK
jgi:formylglycine-generating enzyme required for sulfatase activity